MSVAKAMLMAAERRVLRVGVLRLGAAWSVAKAMLMAAERRLLGVGVLRFDAAGAIAEAMLSAVRHRAGLRTGAEPVWCVSGLPCGRLGSGFDRTFVGGAPALPFKSCAGRRFRRGE